MDLINNLVFTALNPVNDTAGNIFPALNTRFYPLPPLFAGPPAPVNRGNFFSYNTNIIEEFCASDDAEFIEDAIQKHWGDMVLGRNYVVGGVNASTFIDVSGNRFPPYHLIFSYLVENTRIAQIFERLLYMYTHDEKLNKITPTNVPNRIAFQWIANTENLFFKNLGNYSYRNITSQFRNSAEANRRNAYFRLFGMELAFGDPANTQVNYHKAEFNNQPFIVMFEKFLIEIWQAYSNARNSVGPNTTDYFSIIDTAQKIREMLIARRTTDTDFNNYRYFNLSREEYSSVVMMSWLTEVISYDSPVVSFLRCNGGTPGERLMNIGTKVGLPAHSKSEGLLDIARPMNTLLRSIEFGAYSNQSIVQPIIESQLPGNPSGASLAQAQALIDILQIISNWEKATGHRIKNPEANITGTVKVQQNGSPAKQKVTMN